MSQDWRFDAQRLLPDGPDAYPRGATELLEAAYRASLHLEEGRVLRFACALVANDARVPYQVRLADEPKVTAQRLRKLGVAMAPGSAVLVARGSEPPVLSGICSLRTVETVLPHSTRPPPLVVAVRGLGELRVDHGGAAVVFARDRYLVPTSDRDILALISPSIAESLIEGVKPKSMRLFADLGRDPQFLQDYTQNPDPAPWLHRQAARNLRSLARAIRHVGGGGSVLIVPDAHEHPAQVCDKLHKLAVPGDQEPHQEWSGTVMEVFALQTITPRSPPLQAKLDDPYLRHAMEAHRYADEEIQETAYLALADGAVILDWMFTPLAIGAKLKTGEEFSAQVDSFLREREKGMRHRSMATAVNSLKGAVGIVVSSDGDCTLFGNLHEPVAVDLVL